MNQIFKYPRTRHIEGSRLQKGDEDLNVVPFKEIAGRHLAVEEKIDGSNVGISFDESGKLHLQSRGHFLSGGPREKQFALFKSWAAQHSAYFWDLLGAERILYGEWMYAKHTVFYDQLPHYFFEFDIFEKASGSPDYHAYEDFRCEVILLSGLPGSGKDAWIRKQKLDWPVISLDQIREENDVDASGNQAAVVAAARDQAREYLRKGTSFVWNATNVSRQIRRQCIDLFADYNAKIKIVYLETSETQLRKQNRQRERAVPESVIDALLSRWEVPEPTEAHEVECVIG